MKFEPNRIRGKVKKLNFYIHKYNLSSLKTMEGIIRTKYET